jgi:hypothetical protein
LCPVLAESGHWRTSAIGQKGQPRSVGGAWRLPQKGGPLMTATEAPEERRDDVCGHVARLTTTPELGGNEIVAFSVIAGPNAARKNRPKEAPEG